MIYTENLKICSQCKGACCKRNPGYYYELPKDFEEQLGKTLTIGCSPIMNPIIARKLGLHMNSVLNADDVVQAFDKINDDKKIFEYLLKNGYCNDNNFIVMLFYLRPMGVNDKYKVSTFYGDNNQCVYLTDSGCRLNHDDRPDVCRELIPKQIGDKYACYMPDSFESDMDNLMKYQSVLAKIALQEAEILVDSLVDEDVMDIVYSILELDDLGELFLNKK